MSDFLTSLRFVLVSMFVCCVAYPAVMLGFAHSTVPWKADGSMLVNDQGQIIGSALIAQNFTRPEYFWPRPSAVDFNASATGGSNLSPANAKLNERARVILSLHGSKQSGPIPADLVTTSGSGIDPHISMEAARFQLPRVAAARSLAAETVDVLISQNSEVPTFRVFGGQLVVNVLKLNLALDAAR